jgi:16S rRNA (guanine527-N7)-methyltransferase
VAIDDRIRAAVDAHVRLLLAWNEQVNLTAIRDPRAIALDHVADSLSAIPHLRTRGLDALLDLGSGPGFPGIPLAYALPARRSLLVEPIGRKARFLTSAVAAVGVATRVADRSPGEHPGVEVIAARAEELAGTDEHRGRWPIVTGRAVGTLVELAEIGLPLVSPGGVLVAWKRHPIDDELAAARPLIGQLGGSAPLIVDARLPGRPDNLLVVTEKAGPTPTGFPRSPAVRRRRSALRGRGLR